MPKGRILCTEDDPDSLELMTFILQEAGYEVIGADQPAHALSLAKGATFDLLLLDNWMPGLSGSELTRRIRMFDKTTPILFYSGAVFDSDRQKALAAGAQGYLNKPNDLEKIVPEVDRLIAASRKQSSGSRVKLSATRPAEAGP